MNLFIDTETNGKFDFKLSSNHPSQPRVVQLAAIMADADGKVHGKFSLLISPGGWSIPSEATAVHGLSSEDCLAAGVPMSLAIDTLAAIARKCDAVVAHNLQFDYAMIDRECVLLGRDSPLLGMERFCTMAMATPVLKIPGKYGDFKWPTLSETHQHFFSEPIADAHDAFADVEACRRCYYAMRKQPSDAIEVI